MKKYGVEFLIAIWGITIIFTTGGIIILAFKAKFPQLFFRLIPFWSITIKILVATVISLILLWLADMMKNKGAWGNTWLVTKIKGRLQAYRKPNAVDSRRFFLTLLTLVFVIIIALLEFGFRLMHIYSSAAEINGGKYVSIYEPQEKGWLHIFKPNISFTYVNKEFIQKGRTNAEGFVDHDWQAQKKAGGLRVACLGDSFTEGIGAPADSSYPALLQKLLPLQSEVMNFGISGSDPISGFMVLRQKVLKYHPDIITLTINLTDINEVIVRGGFERFNMDGTTHYRAAPWWEPLYCQSYIVRLFENEMMDIDISTHLPLKEMPAEKDIALQKIEVCLDSVHAICSQNHIRCIFIFHPWEPEVKEGKMKCEPIMHYAQQKNFETLDMLKSYGQQGLNSGNSEHYFWKIDRHPNPVGYSLFAQAVLQKLRKNDTLDGY